MIDTPQIVQADQVRPAIIKLTCPRKEIQNVMGPAIGELMQTVMAQGVPDRLRHQRRRGVMGQRPARLHALFPRASLGQVAR